MVTAPRDFRRARPDGINNSPATTRTLCFSRSPAGLPGREQRLFRLQTVATPDLKTSRDAGYTLFTLHYLPEPRWAVRRCPRG